jgi:tetratricopeptide (TPR) repeat protein
MVPGRRADAALALTLALALGGATFALFAGVRANEFLLYDDATYVGANPAVKAGLTWQGLRWAFANGGYACNFHPLAWLSHMLDVELFELRPSGHHLTSAALHALSAALCFAALRALTRRVWVSLVAAGLFAFHPLRVESVAWVAERKDLLAGVFFFLTLLAWRGHVARPGAGRYAFALGLFALGLLAKPMLVTLPGVLLLLDVWPLRRWSAVGGQRSTWALLLEKLPFALLALASAAVTIRVQAAGGCTQHLEHLSLGVRAENALVACLRYLRNLAWPHDLAVFYPHPAIVAPRHSLLRAAGLAALALAALLLAAWKLRKRGPYIGVGLLWFHGMLVPVIGLVQVGGQALADRYTYLPSVGIELAVACALAELGSGRGARRLAASLLALVLLVAPLPATLRQIGVWKDTRTLFEHALLVTEGNYVAHVQVGRVLGDAGAIDAARAHFEAALAINPGFFEARYDLAGALYLGGDLAGAERECREALRLRPDDERARAFLARLEARRQEGR